MTKDINPYQTPKAELSSTGNNAKVELPAKIQEKISLGVVTGIMLTLFSARQTILGWGSSNGIDSYTLIYTLALGGLTFGLFKHNRTCAILLLGVFGIDKILGVIDGMSLVSLVLPAIFACLLLRGIIGTFAAHTLQQQAHRP